jgi:hypothetical protein
MNTRERHTTAILLACITATCFLSGCISHQTHPRGISPHAYTLQQKKYEIIARSRGQSSSFRLFWFVPVTDQAAYERALAAMIHEKGGDNVIHVRSWHERQYWIVGTIDVLYVEGDVIRYIE